MKRLNSKSEARNPKQTGSQTKPQIGEIQNPMRIDFGWNFEFSSFEFVSDFDIRIFTVPG
jgi:hypothetical protein